MTDTDKMRERFEKWAVSEGMPITRGHYYDVYASVETRAAYLAWQAAQAEQSAELERLRSSPVRRMVRTEGD